MILVIAPEHRQAEFYLTHRDPPVNPRSRDVIILTHKSDVRKVFGLRFTQDDEIVWYNEARIHWETSQDIRRALSTRAGYEQASFTHAV